MLKSYNIIGNLFYRFAKYTTLRKPKYFFLVIFSTSIISIIRLFSFVNTKFSKKYNYFNRKIMVKKGGCFFYEKSKKYLQKKGRTL